MKNATPPAERLLNLVIALVNTTKPLTRRDIQRTVVGYDVDADDKAFERMFERDKDMLRELGVPIVVVESELSHSTELGYQIEKDQYASGEMTLTPAEIGVLSLATKLWQDTSLESETQRGLVKLKPNALSLDSEVLSGFAPRLGVDTPALAPILEAATAAQRIQFSYRTQSTNEYVERTIEPWSVLARGSGWYVVGLDVAKQERRLFKLSRISGKVKKLGKPGSFAAPTDIDFASILDPLSKPVQEARVALRHGRARLLRARGQEADFAVPPGFDSYVLNFRDPVDLADELAGLGPDVLVVAPLSLRSAVIERLSKVVELYSGGAK